MRGGNEERLLVMKEDEKIFYCAHCPPEMQTARESETYGVGNYR